MSHQVIFEALSPNSSYKQVSKATPEETTIIIDVATKLGNVQGVTLATLSLNCREKNDTECRNLWEKLLL
jgi:hypothetical protein